MYKICVYVPETHKEEVKNAMFDHGAGKSERYSCVAWQTEGETQFIPLEGSKAFIGEKNRLTKVTEYKIELVCDDHCLREVITALKKAHPYEEPAYHAWKLEEV